MTARTQAGIDANAVKSLLAVSSADGESIVVVWADPDTHALLVKVVGGGGGSNFQLPTSGAVNGINQTFVWATAPNVIMVDGVGYIATSQDGTVNWTGTTTTVFQNIAPNGSIFSPC